MTLVEAKEVVTVDGIKILFLGKTSTGMVRAIDGCAKQTACHNVTTVTVHKILAAVGRTDGLKPVLRKGGIAQHIVHQAECLRSMTAKGIKGNKAMMDGYRQLEPRTQPVESFSQSRSRKADSALAQQAVCEEGLQQAVLLAHSRRNDNIETDGWNSVAPKQGDVIQRDRRSRHQQEGCLQPQEGRTRHLRRD